MALIDVVHCEFVQSASSFCFSSKSDSIEVAFVGRSNVGKSTFVNFLSSDKKMARVSKSPGCTKLLNVFSIKLRFKKKEKIFLKNFTLVDLPGIGYARASAFERKSMLDLISEYMLKRKEVRQIMHFVDCRAELFFEDLELSTLAKTRVKFYTIVLTKIDKMSKSKINEALNRFSKFFSIKKSEIIMTSAKNGIGKHDVAFRMFF